MVPLLVFLIACLVLWIVLGADGQSPPTDLSLVVRVRDSASGLESVLRGAQRAGIARLTVVDEGSTDGSAGIVALWARAHTGVEVGERFDAERLGASVLVLDLRGQTDARAAERTLRWLEALARP